MNVGNVMWGTDMFSMVIILVVDVGFLMSKSNALFRFLESVSCGLLSASDEGVLRIGSNPAPIDSIPIDSRLLSSSIVPNIMSPSSKSIVS